MSASVLSMNRHGDAQLPECDSNLVPLVLFLFVAGAFLWSSLQTGVQTTRVVVRMARSGCADGPVKMGKRGKLLRRGGGASVMGAAAVIRLGFQWSKSCVTLGGNVLVPERVSRGVSSLKTKLVQRKQTAGQKSKVSALPQQTEIAPQKWGALKVEFVKNWIPYRFISKVWGVATRIPLIAYPLKWAVYQGWATAFGCNLDEMRFPLEQYSSLCDFFLRPLKDGVRRVDTHEEAMVSPVDGKVLHVQSLDMADYDTMVLEQVKGVSYSLKDFVGELPEELKQAAANKDRQLNSCVLYLSPGDYHHFHGACEASFTQRRHFPGALMPVKPSLVQQVPGLYALNERVVLNGSWREGYFGYVAVGALNVGSIEIDCDPQLQTNVFGKTSGCFERTFEPAVESVRAEKLGCFNLGSTVVLIFESDKNFQFNVKGGDTVRVGQRLDTCGLEEDAAEEAPMMCPPWPAAVAAKAAQKSF